MILVPLQMCRSHTHCRWFAFPGVATAPLRRAGSARVKRWICYRRTDQRHTVCTLLSPCRLGTALVHTGDSSWGRPSHRCKCRQRMERTRPVLRALESAQRRTCCMILLVAQPLHALHDKKCSSLTPLYLRTCQQHTHRTARVLSGWRACQQRTAYMPFGPGQARTCREHMLHSARPVMSG